MLRLRTAGPVLDSRRIRELVGQRRPLARASGCRFRSRLHDDRTLYGDADYNGGYRPGTWTDMGMWLDCCKTVAIEGDYFWAGDLNSPFFASSNGDPILGRRSSTPIPASRDSKISPCRASLSVVSASRTTTTCKALASISATTCAAAAMAARIAATPAISTASAAAVGLDRWLPLVQLRRQLDH